MSILGFCFVKLHADLCNLGYVGQEMLHMQQFLELEHLHPWQKHLNVALAPKSYFLKLGFVKTIENSSGKNEPTEHKADTRLHVFEQK